MKEVTAAALIVYVLDKNGFYVANPRLFFDKRNVPQKITLLILSAAELKARRQFCDRAGKIGDEARVNVVNKVLSILDELRVRVGSETWESFSEFLMSITQILDMAGENCHTIGEIMLSWSKAEREWAERSD